MVSACNRRKNKEARDIEEWRDVAGFEGYYQVSSLGRVKSLERDIVYKNGRVHHYSEKILRVSLNAQGYRKSIFSVNGVHTTPRICRLVASAFIPNPNNYPQVNHKDENKLNDCADNLEWCTSEYNMNYGTGAKRRGISNSIPVLQYDLNGEFIAKWNGLTEAEKALGIYHSHISACCKGKLRQTGGYIWRYANQ